MPGNKVDTVADLERIDAHEITPKEYEEIPELTEEDFARGQWHVGGIPVSRRRGRPAVNGGKDLVSLRIDKDIIRHFRAGGAGWQGRINAALRKAAGL